MEKNAKIYVAGHRGMVGSAIIRKLKEEGFENIIFRTSSELDLRNQQAVSDFFQKEKPDYVFLAAAKVGGILANNTYRAEFLYDNLMIQSNIIDSAHKAGVTKLMFLGSSCIYPKLAPQPLKEEYLLTGELEPTNEPYAIAKIAGIKMCDAYRAQYGSNFISVMPTNLYGPNDNYDLEKSHVLPALIRKFHEAKKNNLQFVEIWGDGLARREFMYAEDLSDFIFYAITNFDKMPQNINVGLGYDYSINDYYSEIATVLNYKGKFSHDLTKPTGMKQKLIDDSKLKDFGWSSKTTLTEGLRKTIDYYKSKISI